jgi:hypothetical protein
MTPLQQLRTLAESARARQRAFGDDAKRATEKAAVAEREAIEFEDAVAILEEAHNG